MVRSLSITVSTTTATAAFSVALIAGLVGGNSILTTLERALTSMAVCFIVGFFVGLLLDGVIKRHAQHGRLEMDQAEQDQAAVLDADLAESNVGDSAASGEGLLTV